MSRVPRWARVAARAIFALAGIIFLVWAFLATWERSEGLPLAPWPRLVASLLFATLALGAAVRAWAVLLGVRVTRQLAWGFFLSQLGKYVPGGVWQAAGQIGYASQVVSPSRATGAFTVFALVQASAGAALGSALVAAPGALESWFRILPAIGPVLLLLLHRSWMVKAVGFVARLRKLPDIAPEEVVPSNRAIWASTAWSGVAHVLFGIGFVLVLPASLSTATVPAAVFAFPLAWTVGFLALPFPAGVGIREAVLIGILPQQAAVVIAASVTYRLVLMASETVMIGTARLVWRTGPP